MRYGFRFSGPVSASSLYGPHQTRVSGTLPPCKLRHYKLPVLSLCSSLLLPGPASITHAPDQSMQFSSTLSQDVPGATFLLSSAAQGQAPALECCSLGRTARGISSQLLFHSALTFSTEGLSNFEKRHTKIQIPRTL